ncbi:MAG: AAA family ATPase [Candidatus Omnitrophota bacterium]
MYFKKLEVYGFKSFVDKTTLIFEPGVTAIVGPNGTGKSNISDAIKWVLGEQSAKSMRGAKMEDVIFNGTETRQPVNMAEVSLTLSNEEKLLPIDYDEVTITRRLYRSGESEYLLNKTLVRLKDINELLMGTGIGTESYSLLEQGRIDAILSSKPEERRVIFEEASGITKYKKKKNEALRKLEATEENLLRVNDIIVEVNRQLNSIQRQVSKARRYKEQFDALKTMDTQYTFYEYNILNDKKVDFEKEEKEHHTEQSNLENDLVGLSQEFQTIKETLGNVEQEYNRLHSKVLNASTEIEKNRHSISLNKERVEEFTKRAEDLCKDIENSSKKIADMSEQFKQLESRIASFQSEKNEKEHKLVLKRTAITDIEKLIKETHNSIDASRLKAVNLLAEHAQLKNELTRLSANIHNTNARLLRLRQEKEKTTEELNSVNDELKNKIDEVHELREKLSGEENKSEELNHNRQALEFEINGIKTSIQESKQSLVASQSQLEMLEKLSKNYEGFSDPVKSFMLKKNDHPELFIGVYDVLVNLIEVRTGYELCVELAMGEYLQAVIVENKQLAFRLSEFVEKEGMGRIRFISLDSMQEVIGKSNVIESLRNIVEVIITEEKYKKVITHLLRNTFILENAQAAEESIAPQISSAMFSYHSDFVKKVAVVGDFNNWNISAEAELEAKGQGLWQRLFLLEPGSYRYKFVVDGKWIRDPDNPHIELDAEGMENSVLRVVAPEIENTVIPVFPETINRDEILVTVEGRVYTQFEMISKPAKEQWMGLISQKAQIKHLIEQCANLKNDIADFVRQEEVKQQQLAALEVTLKQLNNILNEEKITLANRDSEKNNIEVIKKKLDDELSIIDLEIDETTLDEQELVEKEKEKKNRLEIIDQETSQNEQEMAAGQEVMSVKTLEREELLVVMAEMKTEFSHLNEQEKALNDNFVILKRNIEEQNSNLQEYSLQKEEALKRTGRLKQDIESLEQNTSLIEEQKIQTQVDLEQTKTQRSALLTRFEEMQNQIKLKDNKLNNIKNNIRDIDVKKVELSFKIEALVNAIQQFYKLDLKQLQIELPQGVDWLAQKEEIDLLRGKIDRLGAVNLAAVEEEEELRERSDFLSSQKEDLVAAKQTLMHAITKINRTTRSLFLETFEKSKVAFKEYFKLLFGGGEAQLFLMEEKDVLESGIEIVVRPPGKKLQSITLLSGGEKTLTAIALLFGVFKIKPTPFCILDEMDAPLDEANIDRFTRVLQEFIKNSQFIIITHNKKTICTADVMYGVTMEEPGISKLVSVKFSEFKEDQESELQPAAI